MPPEPQLAMWQILGHRLNLAELVGVEDLVPERESHEGVIICSVPIPVFRGKFLRIR
jgi:hypothetical protein